MVRKFSFPEPLPDFMRWMIPNQVDNGFEDEFEFWDYVQMEHEEWLAEHQQMQLEHAEWLAQHQQQESHGEGEQDNV